MKPAISLVITQRPQWHLVVQVEGQEVTVGYFTKKDEAERAAKVVRAAFTAVLGPEIKAP